MRKNSNVIILTIAILLIALLLYSFLSKRTNWFETYDDLSSEPYGTLVIKKLLQKQNEGYNFKELSKSNKVYLDSFAKNTDQNYIFLGGGFGIDSVHTAQLFRFIENGNNAFICSYVFSDEIDKVLARLDTITYPDVNLEDSIKSKHLPKSQLDIRPASLNTSYVNYFDSISLHFIHPDFKDIDSSKIISYRYDGIPIAHYFSAYQINNFRKPEDVIPLGTQKNEDTKSDYHLSSPRRSSNFNFIKVKIGKGTLYLHSTPLIFTNYYLRNASNLTYSARVFSHFPKGNIIWDSKNRYSREYVENKNRQSNNFISGSSPLQFILKQPALRKAWFILLSLVIIYIVFTSKRVQRIIPVNNEPINENLRLLELLASRCWRNKEYNATVHELFHQFKMFVKKRYRAEYKENNPEFIAQLSESSNIPTHIIQKITGTYFSAIATPIKEPELAEMFQALHAFYSKSI